MDIKGAGGTPGGVWTFLAGLTMVVVGGYLLLFCETGKRRLVREALEKMS